MKYIIALILTFSISIAYALDLGFSSSVVTLATADVRQPISASIIKAGDFIIQNPAANIVSVFVGGSDVTTSGATKGVELVPGASISFEDSFTADNRILSSAKIFLVSTGTAIPVVIGRILQ